MYVMCVMYVVCNVCYVCVMYVVCMQYLTLFASEASFLVCSMARIFSLSIYIYVIGSKKTTLIGTDVLLNSGG